MTVNKNGKQLGAENLKRLHHWVSEREAADDWDEYAFGGGLNKKAIAVECDFDRKALSPKNGNKAMVQLIQDLEERLGERIGRREKRADPTEEVKSVSVALKRAQRGKAVSDDLVSSLQMENAALREEVRALRQDVQRHKFIADFLADTGRMPDL